jgi:hypothetical protein
MLLPNSGAEDAERATFVEAVAPVVEAHRRMFGHRLLGYLKA